MIRQAALGFIRLYQIVVSPMLGKSCRFHPTCSCYAKESIENHGVLKGGYLSLTRILKCHPWNKGGYDPVPESEEQRKQYKI